MTLAALGRLLLKTRSLMLLFPAPMPGGRVKPLALVSDETRWDRLKVGSVVGSLALLVARALVLWAASVAHVRHARPG